jgi:hypothetical protein
LDPRIELLRELGLETSPAVGWIPNLWLKGAKLLKDRSERDRTPKITTERNSIETFSESIKPIEADFFDRVFEDRIVRKPTADRSSVDAVAFRNG